MPPRPRRAPRPQRSAGAAPPRADEAARRPSVAAAFGERLRSRRAAAELTQAALAERAGLDVSYVSQMERGLRDPSLSSIEALAGALGLSLAEFFEDAGDDADTHLARSLAAELAPLDAPTRRDAVEILRRFRASVERATPRRRRED